LACRTVGVARFVRKCHLKLGLETQPFARSVAAWRNLNRVAERTLERPGFVAENILLPAFIVREGFSSVGFPLRPPLNLFDSKDKAFLEELFCLLIAPLFLKSAPILLLVQDSMVVLSFLDG